MGVGTGRVAVGAGGGEVVVGIDVGVDVRVGKPRQPVKVAHCASSENSASTRAIRLSSPSRGLGLDLDMSLLLNRLAGCEPIFEIRDGVDRLRVWRKTGLPSRRANFNPPAGGKSCATAVHNLALLQECKRGVESTGLLVRAPIQAQKRSRSERSGCSTTHFPRRSILDGDRDHPRSCGADCVSSRLHYTPRQQLRANTAGQLLHPGSCGIIGAALGSTSRAEGNS